MTNHADISETMNPGITIYIRNYTNLYKNNWLIHKRLTSGQSNLVKGRIATAQFLYFAMGRHMLRSKVSVGDLAHI